MLFVGFPYLANAHASNAKAGRSDPDARKQYGFSLKKGPLGYYCTPIVRVWSDHVELT